MARDFTTQQMYIAVIFESSGIFMYYFGFISAVSSTSVWFLEALHNEGLSNERHSLFFHCVRMTVIDRLPLSFNLS